MEFPGKCNFGRVAFQEFNDRHRMLQDNHKGQHRFLAGQCVY